MTEVQAATVGPLLAGKDVVAKAKTGTGKTLAFLVPIVECIRAAPGGVGGTISALVLSPTRELAAQISDECKTLLHFHAGLGVLCFFGGTKIKGDHRQLSHNPVDVLVATPGRMQDHLDHTPGFQHRLSQLKFLTLDEADQLLDMGFRDSILKILGALPPSGQRQGALFSATFPASVDQIAKLALRSNHQIIDTVKPEDEVTPDQIDQCVSITNMEGMVELLWAAVHAEVGRHPKEHKIMVFFTTARLTQLYSELFGAAGMEVYEIHSRKSQAHRTKCADRFRSARCGIVFSSDVSARGLDYPDVTAVIQVGLPSARDQYIHRLGRTGRAGKSGRCILLLHDFEEFFLRQLQDLPLERVPSSSAFPGAPAPPDALWQPHPKSAGQAYQAWLGYYNSARGLGWPKDKLVREATRFAASIGGLGNDGLPPPILKKTVGQMGLRGVSGLNIVSQLPYSD
jgi:ATP-dependent RNA helicase MSS116